MFVNHWDNNNIDVHTITPTLDTYTLIFNLWISCIYRFKKFQNVKCIFSWTVHNCNNEIVVEFKTDKWHFNSQFKNIINAITAVKALLICQKQFRFNKFLSKIFKMSSFPNLELSSLFIYDKIIYWIFILLKLNNELLRNFLSIQ